MAVRRYYDKGNYDKEKVVELIELAAGDRSLRQYATDAGLSPGHLYRVKSGDYKLTPGAIRQLTSEEANPQENIGFEDLMKAAGYQDDYQEQVMILPEEEKPKPRVTRRIKNEYEKNKNAFENIAEGIILKSLLNKEMEFNNYSEAIDQSNHYKIRYDMCLKLKKEEIKEWWIEFKFLDANSKSSRVMGQRIINMIFGNLLATPSKKKRKISIAVNDPVFFNQIAEFKNQTSYRGELSVILIDTENFKIEKEVYLSHFDENDKSMEIILSK